MAVAKQLIFLILETYNIFSGVFKPKTDPTIPESVGLFAYNNIAVSLIIGFFFVLTFIWV